MKYQINKIRITVLTLLVWFLFSANSFSAEFEPMDSRIDTPLKAVWGSSAEDVFAVGSSATIIHYNGSEWSKMGSSINQSFNLNDVWGSSDDNVYAVGDSGTILKYNGSGSQWSNFNSGSTKNLRGIWGVSESNFIAVGEFGTALHCDEQSCSSKLMPTDTYLNDIWGFSDDNVYAVGHDGTLVHFNGKDWTEIETGTEENLISIWGNSEDNIFAVGTNGIILYYNGLSWTIMPSVKRDYYAVGGSSLPDIFRVGKGGKISYYDSDTKNWKDMESGTNDLLQGIWVSPENDIFIVGNNGTILFKSEYRIPEEEAPTATFTISLTSGDTSTTFYMDASGCTDFQDSTDILEVQWDWENDGTWDTEYTTTKLASHQYSTEGTYTIKLMVRDSDGLTDTATQEVEVKKTCPIANVLGHNDPRLETLRSFRDQVLAKGPAGSLLISFYYSQEEILSEIIKSSPAIESQIIYLLETVIPVIDKFVKKTN